MIYMNKHTNKIVLLDFDSMFFFVNIWRSNRSSRIMSRRYWDDIGNRSYEYIGEL
jgi:hypothetical protein